VPSLAVLVSNVLVLSCGQTDRITDRITEADDRYTHTTTVGVSKENIVNRGSQKISWISSFIG